MASCLQSLFREIAQVQDEDALRSQILVQLREYFVARRSGLFFCNQLQKLDWESKQKWQLALSVEHNPVLRYLVERHAPVHEELVVSPKTWRIICPRADHWHVMAGPIVSQGQLVGGLGFTRERATPAFDSQNLADLGALCLHLSAWVAIRESRTAKLRTSCLTPREVQIAQLVAQGQTNAEIGAELWITENSVKQALKRMFRKLEVSSRAQMVAQLWD
ncbi:MAG: LuxR C-terminal-related transcriptional regulator [Microcoleaceae cyanobacterium]